MLNVNNEIWKPLKGFEELYQVSNLGRVQNKKGRFITTSTQNSGYQDLQLSVKSKRVHKLLHRVVAEVFIENPLGYPEVHHKDENKHNNVASNLEWVTSAEAKQYSLASGAYNAIFETKSSLGIKHKKTCMSKYHNVTWDKSKKKWTASVRHNKINYFQKRFSIEEDAALHVNWILDELNLTDRPRNVIN